MPRYDPSKEKIVKRTTAMGRSRADKVEHIGDGPTFLIHVHNTGDRIIIQKDERPHIDIGLHPRSVKHLVPVVRCIRLLTFILHYVASIQAPLMLFASTGGHKKIPNNKI